MKKFHFLILIFLFFPFHVVSEETFLSLKKNKVYVRYGPSLQSPIKYVYKKINFPIKQIDKKENFRRIIDFKNNSGWIHLSQLKKINSIIPLEDKKEPKCAMFVKEANKVKDIDFGELTSLKCPDANKC